jgi:putative hemolysin
MVVVIDEYGGTSGIVTMEDLIEEIVGNIFDEYDIVEDEYKKLGDGRHFFRGTIDLDKVAGIIDLELPVKEYDTLSGYLVGLLGRIPKDGETKSIKNQGLEFKILKVKDKRIEEVEIIKEDYRDS